MKKLFFYNLFALLLLQPSLTSQFNFSNFNTANNLVLVRDAVNNTSFLRLTPAVTNKGGAIWYRYQQLVLDTFEINFSFKITNRGGLGGGGDGLAIVIQNSGDSIIGFVGNGLGANMAYGGIPNSLAIEFDSYKNSGEPNNNHISLQSRGTTANNPNQNYSLGYTTNIPSFIDGNIHNSKITYANKIFYVYLDNLADPALIVHVNLDSLLILNSGQAWIGITAATGGGYENHDILSWSFTNQTNPPFGSIPTIIVPGIMGSPLYQNNNDDGQLTDRERIWIDKSKFLFEDNFLYPLSLKEDGNNPLNDNDRIVVSPLPGDADRTITDELNWLPISIFQSFVIFLESNGLLLDNYNNVHERQENLFLYTYDWRKSLEFNSDQFSHFIDSVCKWTHANKVNIVSHSMGGLIAKEYIRHYGSGSVHKQIFVGTPHLGVPLVEHTMLTGNLVLPMIADWFTNEHWIKLISRNMPSIYNLMPSAGYFDDRLWNGVSVGSELYQRCFALGGRSILYLGYDNTKLFMQNMLLPSGEYEFNLNQLDNAYTEHDNLSNVSLSGVEVYNIVGYGLPTPGQVIYTGLSPLRKRTVAIPTLVGDGTVPLKSAEMVNYSLTHANYYVDKTGHGDFFKTAGVQQLILKLLHDPPDTAGFSNNLITTTPPADYTVDGIVYKVTRPVDLHVYDQLGNHTGSIGDTAWEINIPGSIYEGGPLSNPYSDKMIMTPNGQEYILKINSLDTSAYFNFQISQIIKGNLIGMLVFDSVITSVNFSGYMRVANVSPNLDLQADYNGDSIYESVINPSEIHASQPVTKGWNLLSLPIVTVGQVNVLYPNTNSSTYVYTNRYQAVDSIATGRGFWIKFNQPEIINFFGPANCLDSVTVTKGWNLIGSISTNLVSASVTSNPSNIINSNFYGFSDVYYPADTLKPGYGYWIKVNQDGKLILKAK